MSTEEQQHIALPRLIGAPAYARPPAPVATSVRPFDPDELPIEALMTEEEREFSSGLPPRAYAPGGTDLTNTGSSGDDAGLPLRVPRLRSITGRFLGGN